MIEEIFSIGTSVQELSEDLIEKFNTKNVQLVNLKPHQRIFVFFLTRALKTNSAVRQLSREGYGQDAGILLRGLLENLITVRYVFADPLKADDQAMRLVDYKWVIFKRFIANEREIPELVKDDFKRELVAQRATINEKIDEFKKKYKVKSDRALITWSGRSLRDMAKIVGRDLLEEYDTTFRQASRFSHPSILGDSEYMNMSGPRMNFYPYPTRTGIYSKYSLSLLYLLEFLELFNSLFNLFSIDKIKNLRQDILNLDKRIQDREASSPQKPSATSSFKKEDIVIKFAKY